MPASAPTVSGEFCSSATKAAQSSNSDQSQRSRMKASSASHGLAILGLTLGLLAIKGTVVAVLVKLRGSDSETAWRSGVALAQGGEFCFALMAQMQQTRLLPEDLGHLLLAATFCSMLVTPLMLRGAPALAARLHRKPNHAAQLEEISALNAQVNSHVVICGYGRVGQAIARFLRNAGQSCVALDTDPQAVRQAAATGNAVHYGDSQRGELLTAVGLERASLLVIAVDNTDTALQILRAARSLNPSVPILVRTQDDQRAPELKAAGASEVVPELMESSLMLASHALVLLGFPEQQVQERVEHIRRDRYQLLQGCYTGEADQEFR